MCGSVALPSSADISRVQPWVSYPTCVVLIGLLLSLWCVFGERALWKIIWLDEQRERSEGRRRRRLVSASLFLKAGERFTPLSALPWEEGEDRTVAATLRWRHCSRGSSSPGASQLIASRSRRKSLSGARCVHSLQGWAVVGRACGCLL